MLGIILGVLAGLTALVMVALVTAVMAVLSPVLSFYQSIGGMAERAITAWGSANNETGDVEGSRQAA